MQSIDAYARFYIKKKFMKRCIIFIYKILVKFFGFKNKSFLYEVHNG